MKSIVSSKGQIVIPASIREKIGLKPGDIVEFELINGKLVIKKTENPLREIFGISKGLFEKSSVELIQEVRGEDREEH